VDKDGSAVALDDNLALVVFIHNGVYAVADVVDVGVETGAAKKEVVVFAAHQQVSTFTAHQHVTCCSANQLVTFVAAQHEGTLVACGDIHHAGAALEVKVAKIRKLLGDGIPVARWQGIQKV